MLGSAPLLAMFFFHGRAAGLWLGLELGDWCWVVHYSGECGDGSGTRAFASGHGFGADDGICVGMAGLVLSDCYGMGTCGDYTMHHVLSSLLIFPAFRGLWLTTRLPR